METEIEKACNGRVSFGILMSYYRYSYLGERGLHSVGTLKINIASSVTKPQSKESRNIVLCMQYADSFYLKWNIQLTLSLSYL